MIFTCFNVLFIRISLGLDIEVALICETKYNLSPTQLMIACRIHCLLLTSFDLSVKFQFFHSRFLGIKLLVISSNFFRLQFPCFSSYDEFSFELRIRWSFSSCLN